MSHIPNLYSVESVTSGHPDKVCDQVSDAVLDACLRQDPRSRVAVECFGAAGLFVVGGEVTTSAVVDYEAIARATIRAIGYAEPARIIVSVVSQSPDIALGVDTGGAGDQGIMYGYATNETPEFLQRGVVMAHALTRGLEALRRDGGVLWLRPDGKGQVTVENGEVRTVLVSTQHAADVGQDEIRRTIVDRLVRPLGLRDDIEILVNPTGSFVRGGFDADTGLTGRKIMVDTYGGFIPHGGGAFSGKDSTKVDRSAAYMSRFVAKNIVARGDANECLVSVAYAIGRAEPLMVSARDENGRDISELARSFDFRPAAIIERLRLREPVFQGTASYGHFGKPGFSWEEVVV